MFLSKLASEVLRGIALLHKTDNRRINAEHGLEQHMLRAASVMQFALARHSCALVKPI